MINRKRRPPIKRCYFVNSEDQTEGWAYVAMSSKRAKQMAWEEHSGDFDCDWIELRVKWHKEVNVSDLPYGEIKALEGLKRGIYNSYEGIDCPVCGEDAEIFSEEGKVGCQECLEKIEKGLSK